MTVASLPGSITPLLTAVTTGTGDGVAVPIEADHIRVHIRGAGTISAGTIVIEEAQDPAYAGTWSTLQTVVVSALTGGAEQIIHIFGTINAIRARVTVNLTGGGTVTVELVSN